MATALVPDGFFWCEKGPFKPGPGSDIGQKRRLIESYYDGYLLRYKDETGKEFHVTDSEWTVTAGEHSVKLYIKPAPTLVPPITTDPPTPSGPPPPRMT